MESFIPGQTELDAGLLYKILPMDQWHEARQMGSFRGSGIDHADGFIHLSAPHQVVETLQKHFSDQEGLVLFGVTAGALGESLRWEVSRGGAEFPHVHGPIEMDGVKFVAKIVAP